MLRKIRFLIAVISSGCAGLPELKVRDAYVVDVTHRICSHRQSQGEDSHHNAIWKKISDDPLETCNGNVSVKAKDYLAIDDWRIDIESNYTCKRNQ